MMKDTVINLNPPARPAPVPVQPSQNVATRTATEAKPATAASPPGPSGLPENRRSGEPVEGNQEKTRGMPQDELENMVSEINKYLQTVQRDLEFTVHEGSGRTIIKVLDSETKEVIREIPPERVVEMAEAFKERGDLGSMGVAEEA